MELETSFLRNSEPTQSSQGEFLQTSSDETSQTTEASDAELPRPPGRKRSKKYTSPVWQYFDKCDDQFAICTVCGDKYQHSNNTSNLAKVHRIIIIFYIIMSKHYNNTAPSIKACK